MLGFKKKIKKSIKGRRNHPVAKLLENNTGIALTVEKISSNTNMNSNTVRSILRKLIKDGYVKHTTPFFYWKL